MERHPCTGAGPGSSCYRGHTGSRKNPERSNSGRCGGTAASAHSPPSAGGATSPPNQDAGAIGTRRRHTASGRAHEYWVKSPQHAARDGVLAAVPGLKAVDLAIQLASAADMFSTELSSAAIRVSQLVLSVAARVVMHFVAS